jgi:L-ribulokinase
MSEAKYVYGYDFGTLSCRLVVVSIPHGEIVCQEEMNYPGGVLSEKLPGTKTRLKEHWYLQDPADYILALTELSKRALKSSGIKPEDVLAVGTAFTNCTMMPIDQNGDVLCMQQRYKNNPHAWVKLWKHHAAEPYAKEIEAYAKDHWPRIRNYGNNVSSEWLFPKILQILREDREIYSVTDTFIEASDWIVYRLCGNLIRNSATLGVNSFYDSEEGGYPEKEFFKGIDPLWENVIEEKMRGEIRKVGQRAGTLTPHMAEAMGLSPQTVVAVGHGDSEVVACGCGAVDAGNMIMVMGTSTCHQMMDPKKVAFQGMCCVVKDGMIPGMYAYESGQPAVGDIFEWYANHLMPEAYKKEAQSKGVSLLGYMDQKASRLKAGASGLVALDWFNGNRSVLMDYSLTGLVMGLTLQSKPEEIYRALAEATAFGTKVILDSYLENRLEIINLLAAGGLPIKSPFVAQIYADILNREVQVPLISNMAALGAAVCAAVAAGAEKGAFDTFGDATQKMVPKERLHYKPNPENAKVYSKLFTIYKSLYDYFGSIEDNPMKELRIMQQSITANADNYNE